jgi:RNA polymerase sigma factor (TIGR02999 family)
LWLRRSSSVTSAASNKRKQQNRDGNQERDASDSSWRCLRGHGYLLGVAGCASYGAFYLLFRKKRANWLTPLQEFFRRSQVAIYLVEYVEFFFGLIYPLVIHRSSPQEFEGSVGSAPASHVSELLLHWGNGDRKALEAILPLVYNELRRLARYHLRQQRPNHTLQTTALVHEAYLRLAREKLPPIENRVHFLGLAAQLMRWILVDYERNRRAAKRGAGATRLTLDPTVAALRSHRQDVDLLALDEALDRLAKLDGQQSQIIELRYFAGLSIEDTSEFLGISPATVKRSWSSARAWLLREIGRGEARA